MPQLKHSLASIEQGRSKRPKDGPLGFKVFKCQACGSKKVKDETASNKAQIARSIHFKCGSKLVIIQDSFSMRSEFRPSDKCIDVNAESRLEG